MLSPPSRLDVSIEYGSGFRHRIDQPGQLALDSEQIAILYDSRVSPDRVRPVAESVQAPWRRGSFATALRS